MNAATGISISFEAIAGGVFTIVFAALSYFISLKMKKIEKIDDILIEVKSMASNLNSNNETIKELKPKLEDLVMLKREMAAAWKNIDEQKAIIATLREREHQMSNWISIIRGKCETKGQCFQNSWELKKIPTEGQDEGGGK